MGHASNCSRQAFRFRPASSSVGTLVVFLVSLFVTLIPVSGWSQFLIINDCNGFTRAAENVSGKAQRVQFDVGGAQDSSRISLTNNVSGEVRFAAAKAGNVTFFDVLPGIYTVATEETGLVIGAISFTPMALIGGLGATAVGALVVGGGAAGAVIGVNAIADATDGNTGSDNGAVVPTPTPTPAPDDCAVCDPNVEPPPLDEDAFAEVGTLPAGASLSPSN